MDTISRDYGDIRIVIEPNETLAFVERISTSSGIVFHITADFFNPYSNEVESGFSKWENDDNWRLQYVGEEGQISNTLDLSFEEYERLNRLLTKYLAGTL